MLKFTHKQTMAAANPLIALVLMLCLFSCATNTRYDGNTNSLTGLQALGSKKNTKAAKNRQAIGRIREMGLKEIALSLSAQAGLAARADAINQSLTKRARELDNIYDFNALTLEHNVLPPVLLEGRNTFNQTDEQTIRISDRTYKVKKQARFITAPPNWRQYLWMDYITPDKPNVSLLPKTRAERQLWCANVAQGWHNGIDQANTILEENIARLKEDYIGMVLYRKLLAMNMVSPPFVAHTDLGITGDGSEIHIDDRVLRITALPSLNINSNQWRAAVAQDEKVLTQFKQREQQVQQSSIIVTDKAWQPIIAPANK